MPFNSDSFSDQVTFRKSTRASASVKPLGFWGVFGAVGLALLLQTAIERALAEWDARRVVTQMQAELERMESELDAALASGVFAELGRSSSRPAARIPRYPGPISARAQSATHACVNGRTMRRLSNGWTDIGERCRATSQ